MPPLKALLKLSGRLVRRFVPDRKSGSYRPDLSDAAFIGRLSSGFRERPEIRAALESGEDATIRAAVIDHFRSRSTPAFFVSPVEAARLIETVAQRYPHWREGVVRQALADLDEGLAIYDHSGPRLETLFEDGAIGLPEGEKGADNLYRFQPQRMGFLPRLCLAHCHGAIPAARIEAVLLAFDRTFESAALRHGYVTSLLATQRAIALSWSLAFLLSRKGEEAEVLDGILWKLLKLLFSDIDFLSGTIGQSVANNHLLVDGFAGWYFGLLYPEASAAEAMRETGETIWLHELERQIYADGTSFEHSSHYHEMACELALAYKLLKQRNGETLSESVTERLRHMLRYQFALAGLGSEPLSLGDATEDPMFPLDAGMGWATAGLCAALTALYGEAVSTPPADDPSLQRAFWLLAGCLPDAHPPAEEPSCQAFPQGGLYVLSDEKLATQIAFRTGLAPDTRHWAGHMHADFLSLFASVGGKAMLVDGGTYSYRRPRGRESGAPDWRAYFMGPAAHNALSLTGLDPLGRLEADFRNRETQASVAITAEWREDGLTWLEGALLGVPPLAGYRRGLIHIAGEYAVLYDLFVGDVPSERILISFQFAPGTTLHSENQYVQAQREEAVLSLTAERQLSLADRLEGSHSPLGGWVSPSYGRLEAAPQLRYCWVPEARLTALVLETGGGRQETMLAVRDLGDEGMAIEVGRGSIRDTFALAFGKEGEDTTRLWARRQGERLLSLPAEAAQTPAQSRLLEVLQSG